MTVFTKFKSSLEPVKSGKKFYKSKVVIPATKRLEELKPDECRFPQGDGSYLFCGKKTQHGSPYCPSCHAIAHVPLRTGSSRKS